MKSRLRAAISRFRYYRNFYWGLSRRYPFYTAPAAFPPHIELELTNDCNLHCPHCHRTNGRSMQRPIGYVDLGVIEQLADEIRRHPGTILRLVGQGEPSLHPRFFEIVRLLRDRGVKTHITSNGTFLQRLPAEKVLELGLFEIAISIDGTDAESFARFRGGGDYQRLRREIGVLYATRNEKAQKSPRIRIRRTLFPRDSAVTVQEFWREWLSHADDVSYHTLVAGTRGAPLTPYTPCAHIVGQASIRWTGDVILCGHQCVWGEGDEVLGNLNEHSLQALWHHRRIRRVRRFHATGNLDAVDFCKYCKHTHVLLDAHRHLRGLLDVMKRQTQREMAAVDES